MKHKVGKSYIVRCKLTDDSMSLESKCIELAGKNSEGSCVKLLNTTGVDPCNRLIVGWTTYLKFKEYFDLIEVIYDE